jgi:hypothetical protein
MRGTSQNRRPMTKVEIENALHIHKTIKATAAALMVSTTKLEGWANKHGVKLPERIINAPIRTCPECKVAKPRSEFYNKNGKEGASGYCKKCTHLQLRRRQRRFKELCVEYKGGKCIKCGYNRCITALEFHHRDPSEKDFALSKDSSLGFSTAVKQELDKCDILCANCHRETHFELKEAQYNTEGVVPEIEIVDPH